MRSPTTKPGRSTDARLQPEDGEITANFDDACVHRDHHKSQGSEYPAVVIPVMTQHCAMLHRNLLYTGVPRGKKLVVLIGQKKAIAIAVGNVLQRVPVMLTHSPASSPCLTRRLIFAREKMDPRVTVRLSHLDWDAL
jgi:hypothetical protein